MPKDAKGHGSNVHGSLAMGQNKSTPPSRGPAPWYDTPHNDPPSDAAAAQRLREGSGSKSASVPNHDGTIGRHGYNPESVDKAINNASRYQGKVGGKERSAIHRLLRGRG